jgi:hypothetical protein
MKWEEMLVRMNIEMKEDEGHFDVCRKSRPKMKDEANLEIIYAFRFQLHIQSPQMCLSFIFFAVLSFDCVKLATFEGAECVNRKMTRVSRRDGKRSPFIKVILLFSLFIWLFNQVLRDISNIVLFTPFQQEKGDTIRAFDSFTFFCLQEGIEEEKCTLKGKRGSETEKEKVIAFER